MYKMATCLEDALKAHQKQLAPYRTGGRLLLTANFKVTLTQKLGQK